MIDWFDRLPIHRKLMAIALLLTTGATALALFGLVTVDIWRYRGTAENDTTALARVIAENSAAAVVFGDAKEAESILATTRVRASVERACLYLNDGTLFAGYERKPGLTCPNALPSVAAWDTDWITVAGTAPIVRTIASSAWSSSSGR